VGAGFGDWTGRAKARSEKIEWAGVDVGLEAGVVLFDYGGELVVEEAA
jgi:hypothetical protein